MGVVRGREPPDPKTLDPKTFGQKPAAVEMQKHGDARRLYHFSMASVCIFSVTLRVKKTAALVYRNVPGY
jgi:hypothetical protein